MKIVMLNGQNHKGSTYHIGRMIADKISKESEITEFFFPRDMNHFCAGCYKCLTNREACPCYDEKKPILEAIDASDILIITTPTYCMHVSAPLKSFIDVTFDYWMSHRPAKSMFSKRAVIVSTSAGASPKAAMKDVADALLYLGVPSIIKYGIPVQAMNWDGVKPDRKRKIEKATTKIAKKLSNTKKPHVGIKTRFIFKMMQMMQKAGWNSDPIETTYWEQQGWLEKGRPWK